MSEIQERPRVLLLTSELGKGGAERSIALLSKYLERRFDVCLCVLSQGYTESDYPLCQEVVFLNPPVSRSVIGKILAWIYRMMRVCWIKLTFKPVATISFLEGPNYVNSLTPVCGRVVLSVRGSQVADREIVGLKGWIRKKLLIPLLYGFSDRVVPVSYALAEELKLSFGIPSSKLAPISNFYDAPRIWRLSESLVDELPESWSGYPIILMAGRLHQAKGYEQFLTIFKHFLTRSPAKLVILGEGSQLSAIVAKCHALSLSVYHQVQGAAIPESIDVALLGHKSNPFKFYRRADIFVLASLYEGFPNVMAEAILCGAKVIAADCPTGPREILGIPYLDEPLTNSSIKTPLGTLVPNLSTPNSEVARTWCQALLDQVDSPRLAPNLIEDFARRQGKNQAEKWERIVMGEET